MHLTKLNVAHICAAHLVLAIRVKLHEKFVAARDDRFWMIPATPKRQWRCKIVYKDECVEIPLLFPTFIVDGDIVVAICEDAILQSRREHIKDDTVAWMWLRLRCGCFDVRVARGAWRILSVAEARREK